MVIFLQENNYDSWSNTGSLPFHHGHQRGEPPHLGGLLDDQASLGSWCIPWNSRRTFQRRISILLPLQAARVKDKVITYICGHDLILILIILGWLSTRWYGDASCQLGKKPSQSTTSPDLGASDSPGTSPSLEPHPRWNLTLVFWNFDLIWFWFNLI